MTRNRGRMLIAAVTGLLVTPLAVSATSAAPPATPCGAPEFQKRGEFAVPACGAAGDQARISGRVTITNRAIGDLKQAMLIRKGKILALGAAAVSPGDPNATDISFEYTEPAATYQVPIDLVIVPKCGPVLSISVDRPARCP